MHKHTREAHTLPALTLATPKSPAKLTRTGSGATGPLHLVPTSSPLPPCILTAQSTLQPLGPGVVLTSLAWVLATSTHGSQANKPGGQHLKLWCCQRHHGCSCRTRWTPDGLWQDEEIVPGLPPGWDSSCVPITCISHAGCSKPHGTEHTPYPKLS